MAETLAASDDRLEHGGVGGLARAGEHRAATHRMEQEVEL